MANELKPCPFCKKTMMLRSALWPSEGDADAIIHANPTDCPMLDFGDGSVDGSIIGKWNCSLSDEDDFPSDGSCVRCGSVPRNANGLCNTCLDEDADRLDNTRPAAPVEGLEVKLWVELDGEEKHYHEADSDLGQHIVNHQKSDHGVTLFPMADRSQAEAIIAAKNAEIDELKKDRRFKQHVIDGLAGDKLSLQADNAALTARVKKWEDERAMIVSHATGGGTDGAGMSVNDISIRVTALRNELYHEGKNRAEALETRLAAAKDLISRAQEFIPGNYMNWHSFARACLEAQP